MLTRNLLKKHGLDKTGICSSLYKYWQIFLYSYSCLRQKLSLWLHNEEEGLSQALLLTSVTYKYCNEICNNTYNSVPIMQSKVVRNCLKCSQKHSSSLDAFISGMPLLLLSVVTHNMSTKLTREQGGIIMICEASESRLSLRGAGSQWLYRIQLKELNTVLKYFQSCLYLQQVQDYLLCAFQYHVKAITDPSWGLE